MSRVTGQGGSVYALGDTYRFHDLPLEDCGAGWDWRAPEAMSYWLEEGLEFTVDGRQARAIEIHHRSGLVSFDKNHRGSEVLAKGQCRPIALLGSGNTWELNLATLVQAPSLGGDSAKAVTGEITAAIEGAALEQAIDEIVAWLPFTGGAFIGQGSALPHPAGVEIAFNQEGVRYVRR